MDNRQRILLPFILLLSISLVSSQSDWSDFSDQGTPFDIASLSEQYAEETGQNDTDEKETSTQEETSSNPLPIQPFSPATYMYTPWFYLGIITILIVIGILIYLVYSLLRKPKNTFKT